MCKTPKTTSKCGQQWAGPCWARHRINEQKKEDNPFLVNISSFTAVRKKSQEENRAVYQDDVFCVYSLSVSFPTFVLSKVSRLNRM